MEWITIVYTNYSAFLIKDGVHPAKLANFRIASLRKNLGNHYQVQSKSRSSLLFGLFVTTFEAILRTCGLVKLREEIKYGDMGLQSAPQYIRLIFTAVLCSRYIVTVIVLMNPRIMSCSNGNPAHPPV